MRDSYQCALEAGAITGGEQLFRVRAPGFRGRTRHSQLEIEHAVTADGMALAAACDCSFGGVGWLDERDWHRDPLLVTTETTVEADRGH
jgi:hypothetical protein